MNRFYFSRCYFQWLLITPLALPSEHVLLSSRPYLNKISVSLLEDPSHGSDFLYNVERSWIQRDSCATKHSSHYSYVNIAI